ncbi:MAG: copper resistance system multicopper oxidase [Vicinamibacterales bacterium]
MLRPISNSRPAAPPSRRRFVKGLAIGGVAASCGLLRTASAQPAPRPTPGVLSGTRFDLQIGETPIDITGRPRTAMTINGSMPGPLLRWREGDTVTLRVANALAEDTSIHWHGVILPANMDGVPGFSFSGIQPGTAYDYRFTVKQHGTYWYHSHSGFQEQHGVYGPLVIDARDPEPFAYDREHVVMLTDWTDDDADAIFRRLKKKSDYYNYRQRTLATLVGDVRRQGLAATLAERRMWGEMRMSASDLADVSGATYTYLVNGLTPAANWTGLFRPGEKLRLRVINGSAMSYFDVRIPGVKMTVVAADGQHVRPVTVDEFRIATAEAYDVIVEPSGQEAFTIFAQAMDRTGFAAGTLAVRAGLRAPVPALDPRAVLTMADMGHGQAHDMAAMPAGSAEAPSADPHAGHAMPAADPHAGHAMPAPPAAAPDPHAGHDLGATGSDPLRHPASEQGNPLVDMQATAPTAKLSDPGIGLRENGRRVLTYADLVSPFPDPDGREPGRTIELHLTGNMERFAWSFDGVKFSDAEPLRLTYGERVRIVLVNDTMMTHPIHLHGMWSDLEDEQGRFHVRKHTIDMPPGSRRSYRVTADALGRWAYHCHLLFHMEAGMFREVRVEEARRS